jgi:hypothetical protein
VAPRIPAIPGIEHPMALSYAQAITGAKSVGRTVAVVGAGGIGFDVSELLITDSSPTQHWPRRTGRRTGRQTRHPAGHRACGRALGTLFRRRWNRRQTLADLRTVTREAVSPISRLIRASPGGLVA